MEIGLGKINKLKFRELIAKILALLIFCKLRTGIFESAGYVKTIFQTTLSIVEFVNRARRIAGDSALLQSLAKFFEVWSIAVRRINFEKFVRNLETCAPSAVEF